MQPKDAHYEPISYDDYWIAACALKYDCPVLTHDFNHFSRIKGLKLLGPYSKQNNTVHRFFQG
jgi:predicted nucleic acid-binding protein